MTDLPQRRERGGDGERAARGGGSGDRGEEGPDQEDREGGRPPLPPSGRAVASSGGFLSLYKSGQGYWTRLGTAAAAAIILALVANFLYRTLRFNLKLDPVGVFPKWSVGLTVAFVVASVVLLWRYLNKPSVVDFLIATESEMKKVNWTSRRELIGSTKVVIFFMVLIAAVLFVYDLIFGWFFYLIRVLQSPPF